VGGTLLEILIFIGAFIVLANEKIGTCMLDLSTIKKLQLETLVVTWNTDLIVG
jgi:hypothetical protein